MEATCKTESSFSCEIMLNPKACNYMHVAGRADSVQLMGSCLAVSLHEIYNILESTVPTTFTAATAERADRLLWIWFISLYFDRFQVLY